MSEGCDNSLCAVRSRRTLGRIHGMYAGLIACLVPLVLCDLDVSRRLTYDNIFNNTNYAQLQHRSRPYSIPVQTKQVDTKNSSYSLEDERGNELEIDYDYEKDGGGPLLVGYARDPFRYSIPEKDYLRGVRSDSEYASSVEDATPVEVLPPPPSKNRAKASTSSTPAPKPRKRKPTIAPVANVEALTRYMNPQSLAGSENRGKRGVLQLYNMIYCATGCEPLSYKGYGCYCGFLGSGRPTDGIDRCCKQHDRCYENMFCPVFSVYFQPYYWKCYHGEPLCALENYESQHGFINACAARLCECDREFAMCVRRYSCPRRRALCRSSPLRLLQNLLMFR